jgi:hypothetical protein
MCVGSDIMPKDVVSVDAYIGENVDVKSSGLQPGGTFQSKNISWRQEELNWSTDWPVSPNKFWPAIVKSRGSG